MQYFIDISVITHRYLGPINNITSNSTFLVSAEILVVVLEPENHIVMPNAPIMDHSAPLSTNQQLFIYKLFEHIPLPINQRQRTSKYIDNSFTINILRGTVIPRNFPYFIAHT